MARIISMANFIHVNGPALNPMISINFISSYEEVPNHPSVQMCWRMSEVV